MAMKITPIDMEDRPRQPAGSLLMLAACALIIGVLAAVCILFSDIAAAILGAVGLLFGGYAMGLGYRHGGEKRNLYAATVAVGLMLAVIAFMLGFVGMLS